MIQFVADRHEYHDGALSIRSVTQVLSDAGYIDSRWFTEESRDRGSAVHELCQRYAIGERFDGMGRELSSLEYVNAFALWQWETRAYAIETECIVDNVLNGTRYAGRYDLFAEIDQRNVLLDIKTGSKAKWHIVQMAAYALPVKPHRCSILYLKNDGTYKEERITSQELLWGIDQFKEALR